MDARSAPHGNRSHLLRLMVPALMVVIAFGLLPLGIASATARQPEWECSPAAGAETASAPAATPVGRPAPVAFPPEGGNLTVFAAASLTDAFEAIAADLEAANANLSITYNFGGSQALVTQLREGAQADLFASANTAQMDAAAEAGLIAGEPVAFVRNRLSIITPADNPAGIEGAADLAAEGLRLILAQPEVPAGRYARDSVCRMAEDPGTYGEAFRDRVAGNIVSEEEDIRDVLAKVALGEADAGIVYVSDGVAAGDAVHMIDIPNAVNVVATYPVAVLSEGDEALGAAFIAYLLSAEGQETLERYGFEPVQ